MIDKFPESIIIKSFNNLSQCKGEFYRAEIEFRIASNLELLRIVSVLIIILSHYVGHSGFDFAGEGFSFNRLFVEGFRLGAVGVDIFVLISGYFLVTAEFKFSKLIKLECEVLFYSVLLGVVFFFTTDLISMKELIFSFLPSLSNSYWFISTYLLLYLLSPFINKMIHAIGQKGHARLLVILYAVYVLIPTVTNLTLAGTSNIMLFILLYLTAAYYRLYDGPLGQKTAANFLMALFSFLVIAASTVFFDLLGSRFGITRYDASYFTSAYSLPIVLCALGLFLGFKNLKIASTVFFDLLGSRFGITRYDASYFTSAYSLPIVLCALGLFLGFKNLKISYHPAINWAAGSALGVYLLHDNPAVRTFLWKNLLDCQSYQHSSLLIVHAFACTAGVFVVCLLLDKLRIVLLERPLFHHFSEKLSALDQK